MIGIIEIRKREGYEGHLLNYTILSRICLSSVKSLFKTFAQMSQKKITVMGFPTKIHEDYNIFRRFFILRFTKNMIF